MTKKNRMMKPNRGFSRKEGEAMNITERIKAVDLDRIDIDELVELSAGAKVLEAEYKTNELDVPEWLSNGIISIRREIGVRSADALDKRIRELEREQEGLKTREERRNDVGSELERLRARRVGA